MTAWFTPGHGEDLSQRIATAIGSARRRVRIASPVITSGPILGTLAELADKGGRDIAGVVDGPQTATVFQQWRTTGTRAWKIPLLAAMLSKLPFSAKPSTPWTPELAVHDFMHAKVTVADDVAFLGSFNLSRSGEQNAESVLEIHDHALADRLARFVDEVRGRYPAAQTPRAAAPYVLHAVGQLGLSKVLRAEHPLGEGMRADPVDQPRPELGALEDDRVVDRLAGLDQRQGLEELVKGPEAAREDDEGLGVAHEHQLPREEVVELDAEIDVRIDPPARAAARC